MKDFLPTLPIEFDVVVRRVHLHGNRRHHHHHGDHHVDHIHLVVILSEIGHVHRLVRRHHDDRYQLVRRRHDHQQVVGHLDHGRRLRHHGDRQIQRTLNNKINMF